MWFFHRSKKADDRREAQVKAIKKDTYEKIDIASEKLKKVNEILDRDDVTLKIFYATNGDRRLKHGR